MTNVKIMHIGNSRNPASAFGFTSKMCDDEDDDEDAAPADVEPPQALRQIMTSLLRTTATALHNAHLPGAEPAGSDRASVRAYNRECTEALDKIINAINDFIHLDAKPVLDKLRTSSPHDSDDDDAVTQHGIPPSMIACLETVHGGELSSRGTAEFGDEDLQDIESSDSENTNGINRPDSPQLVNAQYATSGSAKPPSSSRVAPLATSTPAWGVSHVDGMSSATARSSDSSGAARANASAAAAPAARSSGSSVTQPALTVPHKKRRVGVHLRTDEADLTCAGGLNNTRDGAVQRAHRKSTRKKVRTRGCMM